MLVKAIELERALTQLANFVAKTETRPALTGIHTVFDGEKLIMEACDSYVASTFELSVEDVQGEEPFDVIIKPVKFKAGKYPFAILSIAKKQIVDASGNAIALNFIEDYEYPSLQRVYQIGEPKMSFTVSVGKLLQVVKGLPKLDTIRIDVVNDVKPITISSAQNKEFPSSKIMLSVCRTVK